jgi:hypothetical protein
MPSAGLTKRLGLAWQSLPVEPVGTAKIYYPDYSIREIREIRVLISVHSLPGIRDNSYSWNPCLEISGNKYGRIKKIIELV